LIISLLLLAGCPGQPASNSSEMIKTLVFMFRSVSENNRTRPASRKVHRRQTYLTLQLHKQLQV